MSDQIIGDDPLDQLRAELSAATPSPDFAARVRQAVEREPAPRAPGFRMAAWAWLIPAAAVVLLSVRVFPPSAPSTLAPSHPGTLAPSSPLAPSHPGPLAPSSTLAPSHPRTLAPSSTLAPSHLRTLAPPSAVRTSPQPPASSTQTAEVITNQPELLRRMWSNVGVDAGLVEIVTEVSPRDVKEIAVAPIAVEPVVVKWMVEPPEPPVSGSVPVIKKAAAAAERSLH